ncbi:MAG: tellurite resistance/C4-dicarboxylate transporter family protein [Deltaproteobacteria bacterium]|nr:tellurite resistance/C4-dicarboxylate transporter family protein [Deltaproteobacteria bacterium]
MRGQAVPIRSDHGQSLVLPRVGSFVILSWKARLAELHPAYFSLVMATGIVAISSHLFGLPHFAMVLSWINLIAYPMIWVLFIARWFLFPKNVLNDFRDHARAPGYFTIVAATGVFGAQAAILHGSTSAATILWWVCVAQWMVCTYSVFTLLTVKPDKPTLAEGINGGWLVAVVATQSVCVLGCILNGTVLGDKSDTLFVLMTFWLGGGMLYLWTIGLIFYRYMFFRFSPTDLMPPYWINMGAVAISTLAGGLLAESIESVAMLAPLRPFVLGLTVMFWATATWWIPMLLVLGFWRHVFRKVPLVYDPHYWGLVFPVGMYSVCTFRLAELFDVPYLLWIARLFVIAAAAVWLLVFLGLSRRLLYSIFFEIWRHSLHTILKGQEMTR